MKIMKPSRDAVVAQKMRDDPGINTEPKLAKEAGMSQSTINRFRNGEQDLTTEKLDQLARALKMTVPELLTPPGMQATEKKATLYRIDPVREKINKLLDATDEKGLELACLAIENVFSVRKSLAPDKAPRRSRQGAGN